MASIQPDQETGSTADDTQTQDVGTPVEEKTNAETKKPPPLSSQVKQKIDNKGGYKSTVIGKLDGDIYQFSQEALTPPINSTKLAMDYGEGEIARAIETNLEHLCNELNKQRLLLLTCPDMRAGFEVACAVASDSRFEALEKRTFLPAAVGVEMRRRSRVKKDASLSTDPAEAKTASQGGDSADKWAERGQNVYTLRDLAVAEQEELSDCVLVAEIMAEDYDILLPSSPTELNQILSGLKDHHRFLIAYVIDSDEERIRCQLSTIDVAVQKIDCVPYMIAHACPLLKNKAQAANLAKEGLDKATKAGISQRDRWGFLVALLNSCPDADDETFAEAFNAELKRWQEQKKDIGKSMEDLDSSPSKRLIQTLKFVAAYFKGLEISVFRKLANDIFVCFDNEEANDAARVPEPIFDKEGKLVEQKPLPGYVEQWRRNASSLLGEAELLAGSDGQKRIISFKDPLMEQSVREYFENVFFEKSMYFQKLCKIGALFAVNRDVLPQMLEFYADMAVAEPMGFQDECLPALVEHCAQTSDNYGYERAVESLAHLIQALIEHPACVPFVHRIRHDLIEDYGDYDAVYEIAKRLSLNPKFDSLSWFKEIISKISNDDYGSHLTHAIAQHLQSRLLRHPQGPHATFAELIKWLPEKQTGSLSNTQQFAKVFVITQALHPWFYAIAPLVEGSSYIDYKNFLSVCSDEKLGKELLDKIVEILLPAKADGDDFSDTLSLAAILIGCFFALGQQSGSEAAKTGLPSAKVKLMDALSILEKPQRNRLSESLSQFDEWFRDDMDPVRVNREQYQRLRELIATDTQLVKDLRTRWSGR